MLGVRAGLRFRHAYHSGPDSKSALTMLSMHTCRRDGAFTIGQNFGNESRTCRMLESDVAVLAGVSHA